MYSSNFTFGQDPLCSTNWPVSAYRDNYVVPLPRGRPMGITWMAWWQPSIWFLCLATHGSEPFFLLSIWFSRPKNSFIDDVEKSSFSIEPTAIFNDWTLILILHTKILLIAGSMIWLTFWDSALFCGTLNRVRFGRTTSMSCIHSGVLI